MDDARGEVDHVGPWPPGPRFECRGLGPSWWSGRAPRFGRFACVAGARLPWQHFDSVAVRFELRPLRGYDGSAASYRLDRVSFVGGPGIP